MVKRFSPKDVRDMLDVLAVLESFAARLACKEASDDQIAEYRAPCTTAWRPSTRRRTASSTTS